MPQLTFTSTFPVLPDELFVWHERPGALQRLTPPWINMELKSAQGIRDGDRTVIVLSMGPLSKEWVAVHEDYLFGKQFTDYQESGPFQYWRHTHLFEEHGRSGSKLTDQLDIQMPGGALGERYAEQLIAKPISRAFTYRHRITGQDILLHKLYNPGKSSWRVAITGSSGLIGSELAAFLSAGGHEVIHIVRKRTFGRDHVYWDPKTGEIDRAGLEGLDYVIHLAGENVLRWKWDAGIKQRIRDSRIAGTKLLATTLAKLSNPPKAFLTASGVSIYGGHGSEEVAESSDFKPGGFLTTVARDWERAAEPAVEAGIRTVFLRFGVVLTPRGGALRKILPFFRSGLGGRFVREEQWISWISMDDAIGAIYHSMRSTASGPTNVVSPFALTSEDFSKTLARVVRRPALIRVPETLVQRAFGEVADEVFFESVRANPEHLVSHQYQFLYPQLEGALRHLLGKAAPKELDLSVLESGMGSSGYSGNDTLEFGDDPFGR